MTDAELAAIRERCEKATPGPWEWEHSIDGAYPDFIFLFASCNSPGMFHEGLGHSLKECGFAVLECFDVSELTGNDRKYRADNRPSPEDAAFIAHARTDIPLLLAEIDRLRAALAEKLKET